MTSEEKINLDRLYEAGKVTDRLVTEVASWFLPEIEAVVDRRFPAAFMPVVETYGELLDLIYWCRAAHEVEAVAEAYFDEYRQGLVTHTQNQTSV